MLGNGTGNAAANLNNSGSRSGSAVRVQLPSLSPPAASSSPPSSPSPDVPPPPLAMVKNTVLLKVANVAYFDALSRDFDKHYPDTAAVADRLSCTLHRMLVLNEDTTLVLDYACGLG